MNGNHVLWTLAIILALIAGITDWRSRRIPNWLTVPSAALGLTLSTLFFGWSGAKSSLAGFGLGLLVLFPFVIVNAFGYGDWKLVGASGAILRTDLLLQVFIVAAILNAIIALAVVIFRGRLLETLGNIGHILGALVRFHRPDPTISLDNPQTTKIPFGIAWALAIFACVGAKLWST